MSKYEAMTPNHFQTCPACGVILRDDKSCYICTKEKDMTATVEYQIATYSGQIDVNYDPERDDNDAIIARAKARLTRECGGALPYGYERFTVIEN